MNGIQTQPWSPNSLISTNTPRAGESLLDIQARLDRRDRAVKEETVLGTQVGGSHYTDCKIQPIEYIWANKLGFSEGNIIKYVTRWKSKGGIKDLEKARHHISLLIEHETAKQAKSDLNAV